MRNNKWIPLFILTVLIGVGVWAGVNVYFKEKKPKETKAKAESTVPEDLPEMEDEAESPDISGVLREVNTEIGSITVYNLSAQKEEGYLFDLSTSVRSRYDREMVMKGLAPGSIVELYLNENKRLKKVQESKTAWVYENVGNLEILSDSLSMKIGERRLHYDPGVTVVNGKDITDVSELLPSKDILTVRGMEDKILSIVVTKGHGSIDFVNYDDFIGGSIEIGYDVFDEIKENMKYILREGTYKVVMEHGGLFVNRVVEIERNRIRLLDLSKFKAEMDKNSRVRFQLSPKGTSLFVDGREVNTERSLTLPYGEYIIKAVKEGYRDFEDILKIQKPKEKILIHLAANDEKDEKKERKKQEEEDDGLALPGEEGSSSEDENEEIEETESEIPVKTDENRKISFLKPVGATVFFDNKNIGIIPCETVKVTGEHRITIQNNTGASLSYTVDIADDGEDAVFSFPEITD